ncbi:hypothetical protein DFH05DRAFT_571467 [Lentinula detonsa]|uniref:DUF7330 domain-containing protein n=1 Tax=Lentinula detonsa TaxID=2804962 RepID=A0A9W8P7K9_9AGAR|nr:hypothetical protein DFH05DRAFT_571467 [Lentinula detonsa]
MIISDNTPPSPAKSNAALSNLQPSLESPPPAYGPVVGPSEQQHRQYQTYAGSPSSALSNVLRSPMDDYTDVEANGSRRRESPGKRFCKAFAVAILIYVLVAIFFGTIKMNGQQSRTGWHNDFAIPNGIAVISCTRGSEMQNSSTGWDSLQSIDFSHELLAKSSSSLPSSNGFGYGTVQTSLSLPLSSETLFLLSRGQSFSGNLRIKSSSTLEEGTARVDVRVSYAEFAKRDFSLLRRTTVCLVHKKQGKRKQVGVGLFTSRDWPSSPYPRSQLQYDVTLVLPESRGPSILRINAFETDLPNFHHFFTQSLDEFVTFGELILKAGNGIVNAASITAENATIHTSNREINIRSLTSNTVSLYTINSEIRGHFIISQSIDIKAVNAKVKADIELYPEYPNGGGSIILQTTQKALEAIINIHNPSYFFNFFNFSSSSIPSKPSSTYFISASNKNGIVDVSVPLLPPDSALNLTASSTNGRVTTTLPATYEGSYSLLTTNIVGEVHIEHTEDPEGLERKRLWDSNKGNGKDIRGSVYWDRSNRNKGSVVLKSANGQAKLFL